MWLTYIAIGLLVVALVISVRRARKKRPDGPGNLQIKVKETER